MQRKREKGKRTEGKGKRKKETTIPE